MRITRKWQLLLLVIGLLITGCARQSSVATTDLSGMRVDGWATGTTVTPQMLSGYVVNSGFTPEANAYFFMGLKIKLNKEHQVNELEGDLIGVDAIELHLLAADTSPAKYAYIDEVSDLLGNSYVEDWHDREQGLKARTYEDRTHQLEATFIYVNKSKELVWARLKRTE